MDIKKLYIGRPIRIKTKDDIYDSYISAVTIKDENYVYFKSGSLRVTLLDKLKKESNQVGNKFDVSGGIIKGNIDVNGIIKQNGIPVSPDQKILWSGGHFMTGSQTVYFSERVSQQKNGIVLMFSGYRTDTWEVANWNWASYFISKKEVELLQGNGHEFFMGGTEGLSGFKYLYMHDDHITGHDANATSKNDDYGKYSNDHYVLRYVLGV